MKKQFISMLGLVLLLFTGTIRARNVSVGVLSDWNAAWAKCPAACKKMGGWRGFWACESSTKNGVRRNEFIFKPYACTCECAA